MVLAMAMVIMSSKQQPLWMPPSQDMAHSIIEVFSKMTMSSSNYHLPKLQVTSTRLNWRVLDDPEVEMWMMSSLWMFLLSPFCTSLFLPILAEYKWPQHAFDALWQQVKCRWGFPDNQICCKGALSNTDWLWDMWVHIFEYDEQLFDCFLSFQLLFRSIQPRGLPPDRRIMEWHSRKWCDNGCLLPVFYLCSSQAALNLYW